MTGAPFLFPAASLTGLSLCDMDNQLAEFSRWRADHPTQNTATSDRALRWFFAYLTARRAMTLLAQGHRPT